MSVKFPIVTWQDGQGFYTVSTASGFRASAYGPDEAKCRSQLKKLLEWKFSNGEYGVHPEFSDPNLEYFDAEVRTSYRIDDDYFPAERKTKIKVPVVWGYRDDDLVCCYLPTIRTSFHCRTPDLLKSLVPAQAQRELDTLEPRQLSRYINPESVTVDSINVKDRIKERSTASNEYGTLESVASRFASRENKSAFPQAWQQDDVVEQLSEKLRSQSNLIVLGNHGVGKSTLIVNAIRRLSRKMKEIDADEDSEPVTDRFWFTNADQLIAGMKYLGEWEERVETVIGELSSIQGTLCFESMEPLVRLGGTDPVESIAAFLLPFIQNNELRIVLEANRRELDACRRLLPGFDTLFELFEVHDFSHEKARQVLMSIGNQQKQNLKIDFEDATADLSYRLFKRYFPYETFPGKCVLFWKDLFRQKLEATQADEKSQINGTGSSGLSVTLDDVISSFVRRSGLPEALIRDEYTITPEEVFDHLSSRIIGQDGACHAVTNVVTTLKAGLNDPNRPIGVQLFCGPTGVGKTEMAKTLADYMFGSGQNESSNKSRERLIRLDMSEYSGYGAAEKLLMQASGEPSKFIQQIRENPLVVLLLDEVEKAASEVFDVLMGVFDEGRLTDRWGRTTDFRSCIIIMTSNLGVRNSSPIGFENQDPGVYEQEIKKFFRPEFYNRFDLVVPFQPLTQDAIQEITVLELKNLNRRTGLANRNIELVWSDEAVQFLSRSGFNNRLGARPLQRTIESHVSAPIARILSERPDLRNCRFEIECRTDKVSVSINH